MLPILFFPSCSPLHKILRCLYYQNRYRFCNWVISVVLVQLWVRYDLNFQHHESTVRCYSVYMFCPVWCFAQFDASPSGHFISAISSSAEYSSRTSTTWPFTFTCTVHFTMSSYRLRVWVCVIIYHVWMIRIYMICYCEFCLTVNRCLKLALARCRIATPMLLILITILTMWWTNIWNSGCLKIQSFVVCFFKCLLNCFIYFFVWNVCWNVWKTFKKIELHLFWHK